MDAGFALLKEFIDEQHRVNDLVERRLNSGVAGSAAGIVVKIDPAGAGRGKYYRTKVNFAWPDVPLPHGHRKAPLLGRAVAMMRT